ncbi:lipoxygenase [Chloropicon primus]|uniref:Lipoxygenase n=1 Tax=Chloropicon primus TaxID=1764295 RepID=A0A5B8MWR2_9CHLO|nr:lipoxygenase [Chloropicon primus]|eukprot:QDZ24741.1 lipoxygenase [Chloropicon primus]
MGAAASSPSSNASVLDGGKGREEKVDLRGERYYIELDFIAPPENKKLSNNLALYFKGTNSYSPRIYPAKIASDQRNDFYFDGSKEFRTKEELKTSTQVFDAKVTGLGGTAYRYSFEFRDDVVYGDIQIFWVKNTGADAKANLRVQQARVRKTMSGGLKCTEERTYIFPCHCNVLFGTEKHFYEGKSYLPSETPFHLRKWRARELVEKGDEYELGEFREGLPSVWNVAGDEDLLPEHQTGIIDLKAQAAGIVVATGLDAIASSTGEDGAKAKWQCISHQREEGSSVDAENALVSRVWPTEASTTAPDAGREDGQRGAALPPPHCISAFNKSYWRNDVHFARQFLQGPHAEMLVACKDVSQLPDWLMRKREFTEALAGLQEGTSRINKHVMQEIAHGRIFILDLENVSSFYSTIDAGDKGKHLALGPLCVFYLADDPERRFSSNVMTLLPLVITLDATDSESPVYTPLDDPWLWQLAKCYISSADVQVHITVSLLLNSVVALEPFAISLHESLSSLHPIWKLLYPYLRYKCSEGTMMRQAFFGDSGILEGLFPLGEEGCVELLKEAVEGWSLEDMGFPTTLAMRGLDGTDKLPEYPYRDDGLLIWCTISDFVTSYIGCYYADDQAVEDDYEVQNFLKNSSSLYDREDGDEEEMEALKLSSKEDLVTMATTIIWLCTGYQMGLLKGLYQSMAFIPDRPVFMSEMAPYEKPEEPMTEKEFLEHLPSKGATVSAVAILFTLSNFKECTAALSSKAQDNKVKSYVSDPKALECIRVFESNMDKVEKIIRQRNLKRDEDYPWMLPSKLHFL